MCFQSGGLTAFCVDMIDNQNQRVAHHLVSAGRNFIVGRTAEQIECGIETGMKPAVLVGLFQPIYNHGWTSRFGIGTAYKPVGSRLRTYHEKPQLPTGSVHADAAIKSLDWHENPTRVR